MACDDCKLDGAGNLHTQVSLEALLGFRPRKLLLNDDYHWCQSDKQIKKLLLTLFALEESRGSTLTWVMLQRLEDQPLLFVVYVFFGTCNSSLAGNSKSF